MLTNQAGQVLAMLLPSLSTPAAPTNDFDDYPTCPCCGEPFELELLEVWDNRDFQLTSCCEEVQERALDLLRADGREGAQLLRMLDAEAICGHRLRRVADDDLGGLVLDWHLTMQPIKQAAAKAFVNAHHEHHGAPPGWKAGIAIYNGDLQLGLAWLGRPVGRNVDHTRVLEVNRCVVRRDVPRALRWNACSQLYGWAAREAERLGAEAVITYVLSSEEGTTLRAAGWICEGIAGGGSWNCSSRSRADKAPTELKVRWRKLLKPRVPAARLATPKRTASSAASVLEAEWNLLFSV